MQLSDINVVPVQTGRVHMVFGGNISHKQTPVMVRMTTDPVMVLGGSMGWVITMASGAVQVTHIRVFLTTLKSPYVSISFSLFLSACVYEGTHKHTQP